MVHIEEKHVDTLRCPNCNDDYPTSSAVKCKDCGTPRCPKCEDTKCPVNGCTGGLKWRIDDDLSDDAEYDGYRESVAFDIMEMRIGFERNVHARSDRHILEIPEDAMGVDVEEAVSEIRDYLNGHAVNDDRLADYLAEYVDNNGEMSVRTYYKAASIWEAEHIFDILSYADGRTINEVSYDYEDDANPDGTYRQQEIEREICFGVLTAVGELVDDMGNCDWTDEVSNDDKWGFPEEPTEIVGGGYDRLYLAIQAAYRTMGNWIMEASAT